MAGRSLALKAPAVHLQPNAQKAFGKAGRTDVQRDGDGGELESDLGQIKFMDASGMLL